MTANIEIIIAQFAAICTGNFDFFSPQDECDHAPGGLRAREKCLPGARNFVGHRLEILVKNPS
jgi:hypothetical protein